ncbi:hypothetical protein [Marinilactibacillus psychrotolerans]|uniref:hypothetical protein n=1 Tax=Marinilactibacillus psychrotolerans TaxID=191770 RepID=UPI0039AF983D
MNAQELMEYLETVPKNTTVTVNVGNGNLVNVLKARQTLTIGYTEGRQFDENVVVLDMKRKVVDQ